MSEFVYHYFSLCSYISILCIFIPFWVFIILFLLVIGPGGTSSGTWEDLNLEFWWTLIPTAAVSLLCFLNLFCLGLSAPDGVSHAIKITGRQWYWSYELDEAPSYDSIMTSFINSADKPLRLEWGQIYHLIATSADVIHSFSLPDLAVKVDAIPGRVNQSFFVTARMGIFVGYCSELCGAGHAYMPIVAEVVHRAFK